MRVYIGPYKSWIGPYQISDFLFERILGEDRAHKIGEWLADTWVNDFCKWLDKKRKRKIKVKIHNYDTWGMDHTLAHIILPMLKQLRDTKHGAPWVDDSDVPEHLRSTAAPPVENEWDTDDNHFKRWDWALDEMIFAFQSIVDDNWEDQFHHGVIDFTFVPVKGTENLPKEEQIHEMVKTEKDTHTFDREGYQAYANRIQHGLTLFGKYYQALWD